MALSPAQNRIAITSLALIAVSGVVPPWHAPGQTLLEYHPAWAPPPGGRIAWPVWCQQAFILAIGMLVLLFLRERAERRAAVPGRADWLAEQFR